jgi:hypothetical protein
MASPTGDPFIDAVYAGIPTIPANEKVDYRPDMAVAYGIPYDPNPIIPGPNPCPDVAPEYRRGASGRPICCTIGMEGCFPCFPAPPLGITPEEEARNARNALITLGVAFAIVIPAAIWVLWSERKEAR